MQLVATTGDDTKVERVDALRALAVINYRTEAAGALGASAPKARWGVIIQKEFLRVPGHQLGGGQRTHLHNGMTGTKGERILGTASSSRLLRPPKPSSATSRRLTGKWHTQRKAWRR